METSHSLLQNLQQNADAELWPRLNELYRPLLESWLRRHGLQHSDIDDLVQEVFLALVRDLRHFQHSGQPGAFRAWLRSIVAHRLLHFWRGRDRRPLAPGDSDFLQHLQQLADPTSDPSRRWEEEHDRYLAAKLLAAVEPRFSPTTWQAFRRLMLEEAPAAEVASELGLSVNAVFIAKSRVLRELRHAADGLLDVG